MRKEQTIESMKQHVKKEKETFRRLLDAKPNDGELAPIVSKQGNIFKTNNPMLLLFYQHIRKLKDQIRQRKALA